MSKNIEQSYREEKDEKKLIFAFCVFVAYNTVDGFINRLMNIAIWDSLFTKGLLYGSMAFGLWVVLKRFKPTMLLLPGLIFALFAVSYIFFPYNRLFLTEFFTQLFLLGTIPMIMITAAIKDWDRLYASLKPAAMIVIICAVLYLPIRSRGQVAIGYMGFSYQIMFSVVYMTILSLREKGVVNIVFAVAGGFSILALGARGPLVGLLFSVVIYMLANFKVNAKSVMATLSALFAGILLWAKFSDILFMAENLMSRIGISSRTLTYIIQEDFFNSTGRTEFWRITIQAINNRLLFGYGMGGDRYVLYQMYGKGRYAHNVFLELLVQYGVFLGGLFVLTILYFVIKNIISKQRDGLFYIGLISICSTGLFQLFFSKSYMLEPMFFIMLILCYKINKRERIGAMNKRQNSHSGLKNSIAT